MARQPAVQVEPGPEEPASLPTDNHFLRGHVGPAQQEALPFGFLAPLQLRIVI
jgi:hypothetical protein